MRQIPHPDPDPMTLAEVLERFQRANILCIFRGLEVHAYLDDHEKNERRVYRLPSDRRDVHRRIYINFDATQSRWMDELGSKRFFVPSRDGEKQLLAWLRNLPLQQSAYETDLLPQIRVYCRDGDVWRLDHQTF